MIKLLTYILLTHSLLSNSDAECFYQTVLGAHLRPQNQMFDHLNIHTRIMDVLEQWCNVREEDIVCSPVHDTEICQYHSIEQALLLAGSVRLEDLDIMQHVPTALYDSASFLTNSLLFPGGTHCYIDSKAGAKVLAQPSCTEFFQAVADNIGLTVQMAVHPQEYQYIIARGGSLTATIRSHDPDKILGVTSVYTKTVHLRTEQLMKEMRHILTSLLTIERTAGLGIFTDSLLLPLAHCLHSNESDLLRILANAEVRELRNCLLDIKARPRKSSLFQYLFSNGAEVDQLTNTLSQDISLINSNFISVRNNERATQHSLALNAETMKTMNIQAKQAIKNELAFQIHSDLEHQVVRSNMVLTSQTNLLYSQLLDHKHALLDFHRLLVDSMLHSTMVTCDAAGCIDPTTARVSMPNSNTILISATLHELVRVQMAFVSCTPASPYEISVFHGKSFVLSNDSTALSCPTTGQTFFLKDLKNSTFTDKNTKLLDDTLLYYHNILILLDTGHYRFYCLQPELLIYGNHKIKCEPQVSPQFPQGPHEIWTAQGLILFQDVEIDKLNSKKVLLQDIDSFDYDTFIQLNKNITLPALGPLEVFHNLGPVQQASIVGGISLTLLSICVAAGCCFWFRKRLCPLPCTSPAPAPPEQDRPVDPPPPQEESLRQQLRAAAQFHLRQLHPGPDV